MNIEYSKLLNMSFNNYFTEALIQIICILYFVLLVIGKIHSVGILDQKIELVSVSINFILFTPMIFSWVLYFLA